MNNFANSQQPIANSYTVETLKPRKHRNAKLILYALLLVLVGFFVYSHYIKSDSLGLTQPQTASSNDTQKTENTEKTDSYWGESKVVLPSYPPITSTTDLDQATSEIDIPDFADQITALKELITK